MAVSKLPFGPGSKLWVYWQKRLPEFLAMAHPWTALYRALIKAGVPRHMAAGLTTNLMLSTPAGRAAYKAHHGGKK